MKRFILIILALAVAAGCCACGRSGGRKSGAKHDAAERSPVVEVEMTMENFYDYFEYHEFHSPTKNDDGVTTSMQILYGFRLKDGYEAANLPEYRDTLKVDFKAEGLIKEGDFTVDFETLEYTGTETKISVEDISEDLVFWPKGNRTEIWAFGLYSKSYVMYFRKMEVTAVSGSIYLLNGPGPAELPPVG